MLQGSYRRNLLSQTRSFAHINTLKTNAEVIAREQKYVGALGSLPIAIERGERIYAWDVEGRKYMDFVAGFGAANQGHCHPKILKAMIE